VSFEMAFLRHVAPGLFEMYSLIFVIELTWIYLPMLSTVSLFLDLKQGEKEMWDSFHFLKRIFFK
jgi:hypothetical protein